MVQGVIRINVLDRFFNLSPITEICNMLLSYLHNKTKYKNSFKNNCFPGAAKQFLLPKASTKINIKAHPPTHPYVGDYQNRLEIIKMCWILSKSCLVEPKNTFIVIMATHPPR